MKKRFIAFLLVMILAVSTLGVPTAFAKISCSTQVVAGKTYTVKVSKSATASSIISSISWSGFASGSDSMYKDSNSGMSESITASTSFKITVPSGTPVGSTCTISVSGQISTYDGGSVGESGYSESATLIVVEKTAADNKTDGEPKATKAPTEWELASGQLAGMAQGGALSIDITGGDHKLPASMYNALREKQGTLTLNFPAYSCILSGAALGELDGKSLDLGLTFDADPDFSAAVGGSDVYQLHFAHEGEFPGKIPFKFKAEKNVPGDTVYLYYYYGTSKVIEAVSTAVVDDEGFVTFDIYHCSSYFIASALIEGAAGVITPPAPEPAPEAPVATVAPTPEPTREPVEIAPEPAAPAIATVSGYPLVVLIAVGGGAALIAAAVTMLLFGVGPFRKKRSRHLAE